MEDLQAIFRTLRGMLAQYQPPLVSKVDDDAHYDLWSQKDLVIAGRKRKEISFAALILYKTYVGFYFMPIYAEPEQKTVFAPELLRLLTGKSCFHIKKADPLIFRQIEEALARGYALYQERGWV